MSDRLLGRDFLRSSASPMSQYRRAISMQRCCRRRFGAVALRLRYPTRLRSSSSTASVVLITASGLSDMLSMPCSTKNRANSG